MSSGNQVNNASYKTTIIIGAGKLKQVCWYLTNILGFKNSLNLSSGVKVFLLRLYGAKVGAGVNIKPGVSIKFPWKLSIGNDSWIGEDVWIDNLEAVEIGSNVCISQGVLLLTGNHNYKKTTFDLVLKKIIIEDGVWIGAKSVVCPGVCCYTHSVLSVGSVTSSNLEAYSIYRGNPAVLVGIRVID